MGHPSKGWVGSEARRIGTVPGSKVANKVSLILFVLLLLLISSAAFAGDYDVKNSFGAGEKSLSDLFDEEEDDTSYTYWKYTSRIEREYKNGVRYYLSTLFQERDYTARNLDNDTNQTVGYLSYPWKLAGENSVKTGLRFKHRERYFEETTDDNFTQDNVSMDLNFKHSDDFSIAGDLGFNSYDFHSDPEKNQDKTKGGIEGKYDINNKLSLLSSASIEHNVQQEAGRIRDKEVYGWGFDLKPDLRLLSLLRGRIKSGEGDTKEDEERDDDLDYEFLNWYVRSEHDINKKLNIDFKYQALRKDYLLDGIYDSHGFLTNNGARYQLANDPVRSIYFNMDFEHKEMEFPQLTSLSNVKDSLSLKATYRKKEKWKFSHWIKAAKKEYSDPLERYESYEGGISWDKEWRDKDITLGLEIATRFKDFESQSDETLTWFNISNSFKF